MEKTNGNESISPVVVAGKTPLGNYTTAGLTKREYFAALAMQGMLACNGGALGDSELNAPAWASRAVACADALIASLNKQS